MMMRMTTMMTTTIIIIIIIIAITITIIISCKYNTTNLLNRQMVMRHMLLFRDHKAGFVWQFSYCS